MGVGAFQVGEAYPAEVHEHRTDQVMAFLVEVQTLVVADHS